MNTITHLPAVIASYSAASSAPAAPAPAAPAAAISLSAAAQKALAAQPPPNTAVWGSGPAR